MFLDVKTDNIILLVSLFLTNSLTLPVPAFPMKPVAVRNRVLCEFLQYTQYLYNQLVRRITQRAQPRRWLFKLDTDYAHTNTKTFALLL